MSPTKRVVLQHGAETQSNVNPVAPRAPKRGLKKASTATSLGGTSSATASGGTAEPTVTAASVPGPDEARLGSSASVGATVTHLGSRTDATSTISNPTRGASAVEHEPTSFQATSEAAKGSKKRPAPKSKGKTLPSSTPSKVAPSTTAPAASVRPTTSANVLDDEIGLNQSRDEQENELSIRAEQNFSIESTSDDASDFGESSDEEWLRRALPAKKPRVATTLPTIAPAVPASAAQVVVMPALRIAKAPAFDGLSDLETYINRANIYLDQFPNDSELTKVRMLSYGFSGRAEEMLLCHRNNRNLETLEQLYRALRKVCKKQQPPAENLQKLRQEPKEPCAMFAKRIQRYVADSFPSLKGPSGDKESDKFGLAFFKGGLRPNIAKRVIDKRPTTLKKAVNLAREIEAEANGTAELALVHTATEETPAISRLTNMMETMQRQHALAIEQLQRQQSHAMEQMLKIVSAQTSQAAAPATAPYQHPQATRRQLPQANGGQKRHAKMMCFCCNQVGHGYYACPQATPADVERIKNERVAEVNRRKTLARGGQTQA